VISRAIRVVSGYRDRRAHASRTYVCVQSSIIKSVILEKSILSDSIRPASTSLRIRRIKRDFCSDPSRNGIFSLAMHARDERSDRVRKGIVEEELKENEGNRITGLDLTNVHLITLP